MEEIARMYTCDIHTEKARSFFRAYYKELNFDKAVADDDALSSAEAVSDPDVTNHLISVVIPTFNRKQMLARAVDSVLAQSYPKIEIIIINDCSTDGTSEYLAALSDAHANVRVIHNETHKDPGYSRRLGYLASSGEYIIFMDDDDYYFDDDFFRKAVQKHLEYRNLSFVGANAFMENITKGKLLTKNLNKVGLVDDEEYLKNISSVYMKPLSSFTSIFNKSKLEEASFCDMLMMNDTSIYMRALLTGDAYLLEDIIGVHVVHAGNFSKNLDMPFIIKNIEEKRWVWEEAKRRNRPLEPSWLNYQIFRNVPVFYQENRLRLKDYVTIMGWIAKNVGNGKWPMAFKLNTIIAEISYRRASNWFGARRRALYTLAGRFQRESAGG